MGQTFVDVHLSVIPQRRFGHVRLCQRSLETYERFTHQLQTVNYRCRKREIVAEKSSSRCLSARRLQLYQRQNLIANTIVCSIRCPQKWLFRARAMATAFSIFFSTGLVGDKSCRIEIQMLHRDGDKFRLYIAFLMITASSPYNKNNDYDHFRDIWSLWLLILRNQTTVRNQINT